jgi:acyl carrier protein
VNEQEALDQVRQALTKVVPDADFASIGPHDRLRDVLELDSLDFLRFVEALTASTGLSIDEDDYPRLTTLADSAEFLARKSAQ